MATINQTAITLVNSTRQIVGRTITAINAGFQAAKQSYDPPVASSAQSNLRYQANRYDLYKSYYNNTTFNPSADLINGAYRRRFGLPPTYSTVALSELSLKQGLYRHIRLIYNPTRRLVDFYPSAIYPGNLSEDGQALPHGIQTAIAFPKDMDNRLKDAIAQFWQWSNYQSLKARHVREGAKLGVTMLEVIDDLARGKVSAHCVDPSYVTDLTLDSAGNIKSYAIEFQAQEPPAIDGVQGKTFVYRKEVDKYEFRYFKDKTPFDYNDLGEVQPNRYGFCPAVWIKHTDVDALVGDPVIAGSIYKINELNNLASLTHDQIKKKVAAPFVFWSDGFLTPLTNRVKAPGTDDVPDPNADRETVTLLKGPAGGRVESLSSDLDLSDAAVFMDKLISEIESDHPELMMYPELRAMSQVTGPAAARLVGDVAAKVTEAAAQYDRANVALFQMAVAIAGQNLKDRIGGWSEPNRQQLKFANFDLDSYDSGDLDFSIMPRPLIPSTTDDMATTKTKVWTGVNQAVLAGAPLEFALKDFGMDEDEIADLNTLVEAQDAKQQAQDLALAQATPTVVQAQQLPSSQG